MTIEDMTGTIAAIKSGVRHERVNVATDTITDHEVAGEAAASGAGGDTVETRAAGTITPTTMTAIVTTGTTKEALSKGADETIRQRLQHSLN